MTRPLVCPLLVLICGLLFSSATVALSQPLPRTEMVVFFRAKDCALTPEANETLNGVAAMAKANPSASVTIVGHSDTVGSASHNQRLSECRADAARAALVARGVRPDAISLLGKGETELAVPTADETPEPQNERVQFHWAAAFSAPRYERRTFVVFFPFGSNVITPTADDVVKDAATSAKSSGAAAVRVVGHTDTHGTLESKYALSLARANAVRSRLGRYGVPSSRVEAMGMSDTSLKVEEVAGGERKAANNRVEINVSIQRSDPDFEPLPR